MATANLGLVEPTVGADANAWGTKLNTALDTIDAFAGKLMGAAEVTVASAATCNIGTAASTAVLISGTTNITSFGSSTNTIRFVRFGGTLAINYNATSLILLGGQGRTVRAGDCAIYKSDGSGNWRELSFFRAGGKQNRTYFSGFTDPTGTTSATYVMMGMVGFGINPVMSGSARFMITGTVTSSLAGGDIEITARYGTGTQPVNGAAVTGSAPTTKDKRVSIATGGYLSDFTFYGEFAASLGVANWVDLAIKATGGGTATIKNLVGYIEEIQD